MSNIKAELKEKMEKLEELKKSRSSAICTHTNSSRDQVTREIEIEELEEDIKRIQKRLR